jgi:hypothetical protein
LFLIISLYLLIEIKYDCDIIVLVPEPETRQVFVASSRLASNAFYLVSLRLVSSFQKSPSTRLASWGFCLASLRLASKNRNNHDKVPISQFLLSKTAWTINILTSGLALFPSKSTIATIHLIIQKAAAKITWQRNFVIACSFVDDQDNRKY